MIRTITDIARETFIVLLELACITLFTVVLIFAAGLYTGAIVL